jgi:hypothetical protein
MRKVMWLVLGGLLSFGAVERAARANGLEMLWVHNPSQSEQQKLIKQFPGVLPTVIDPFDNSEVLDHKAESRLETELQTDVAVKDIPALQKLMSDLVTNQALTEKLLGKDYKVTERELKPRDIWDEMLDTPDGILAGDNASMRLRTLNGITALNYKPGTAQRYANGMAHRIERGVLLKEKPEGVPKGALLAFLRDDNVANPVFDLQKTYPDRPLEEMFTRAVDLKQNRKVFEIEKDGKKVSEITVDIVIGRKAGETKTETIGSFEMEGDHLNLTNASQIAAAQHGGQAGPHAAGDTMNPDLMGSEDVKTLHRFADILQTHFRANGIDIKPATASKYVRIRKLLGMPIAPKGTGRESAIAKIEPAKIAKPAHTIAPVKGRP